MNYSKEVKIYFKEKVVGTIFFEYVGDKEIVSFSFSDEYLIDPVNSLILDPCLSLYEGRQYANDNLSFGFINDMLPDRRGKSLISKKIYPNMERFSQQISIYDYLNNVNDDLRCGALKLSFSKKEDKFLDIAPAILNISEIEREALEFNSNYSANTNIDLLIRAGSSLGGARPKSNCLDENKELWIAKFPSKNDLIDVEKCECAMFKLAKLSGINVPDFKVNKFSRNGSTLFSKRFDRKNEKRLHFISAMTLLGAKDGENDNYSYLDLVSLIKAYSSKPSDDLKELYRRIVFNSLLLNCDDHLRNHGFLMDEENNLSLSPAYDLNPILEKVHHAIKIDSYSASPSREMLLNISKFFMLSNEEADLIIQEIKNVINSNIDWIFKYYHFSKADQNYFLECFNKGKSLFN